MIDKHLGMEYGFGEAAKQPVSEVFDRGLRGQVLAVLRLLNSCVPRAYFES